MRKNFSPLYPFLLLVFLLTVPLVAVAQSFIPTDIPNLQLWLRADAGAITDEDNNVSQWQDQSGNDFHAVQSTLADQPLWVDNELNGQPVLKFSGDFMRVVFGEDFVQPNTIFIVLKRGLSGTSTIYEGIESNKRHQYFRSASSPYGYLFAGNQNNIGVTEPTDYYLSSVFWNTLNSAYYRNGLLTRSGNFGNHVLNGLTIGASVSDAGKFTGDIAEIIFYNGHLSEEERQQVENYLMDKYSAELDLGSDITTQSFCPQTLSIDESFTNVVWSTGAEDTHSIDVTESGTYTVTATDYFGRTVSDEIQVSFPDLLIVPESLIVCLNGNISLSANISLEKDYTYQWFKIVADGEDEALSSGHSIDISEAGKYYVVAYFEEETECTRTSETVTIALDDFSETYSLWDEEDDPVLCSGETFAAQFNPNWQYQWSFQDQPFSNSNLITVTEGGEYSLTITNENQCVAEDMVNIVVSGIAPVVDFSFPEHICREASFSFTNLTSGGVEGDIDYFQWFFGDGTEAQQNDPDENPVHAYADAQSYTVRLEAITFSGCDNFTEKQVTVLPLPVAQFSTSQACAQNLLYFYDESTTPPGQDITLWQYDFGDGQTADEPNPIHTYNLPDTYTAQLTVTTNTGCQNTTNETIVVPESLPFAGDFSLLSPSNQLVTVETSHTLTWNPSAGAVQYVVQVAEDEDFSQILATHTLNLNETPDIPLSYQWDSPQPATYFWRVMAYNACMDETESNIHTLQVIDTEGLTLHWSAEAENVNKDAQNLVQSWHGPGQVEALQNEESLQALWVDNALNDKAAVQFGVGNTARYFHFDTWEAEDYTFIGILKPAEPSLNVHYLLSGAESQGIFTHGQLIQGSGVFDGSSILRSSENLPQWQILSMDNEQIFINGEEAVYGAQNIMGGLSLNTLGSRAGALQTAFFSGQLAELMVFDEVLSPERREEIEQYLRFKYFPPLSLGPDLVLECGQFDYTTENSCIFTIHAPDYFSSYLWSTEETTPYITITETGTYSLTVTDIFGFSSTASITIQCPEESCYPPLALPDDIMVDYGFCPVEITAPDIYVAYQWSTGATTSTIEADQDGTYVLEVLTPDGYTFTDSINVSYPQIELSDAFICGAGNSITLDPGLGSDYNYFWHNTAITETITVSQAQEAYVIVTDNNGCSRQSETITVSVDDFSFTLGEDLQICAGNTIGVSDEELGEGEFTFVWESGEVTQFIEVTETGTYTLTITNQNGCSATDDIFVEVTGTAPTIDFTASEVCLGSETVFENLSEAAPGEQVVSWLWDFGDGNTSEEENPTHLYAQAGTYTVSLLALSDGDCSAVTEKQVVVLDAPVADFVFSQVCAQNPVNFTDNTTVPEGLEIISWLWDFGDGNTSQEQHPQHTFEVADTYTVTLQVESSNDCTHSATKEIVVPDALPLPGEFTLIYPKDNQVLHGNTVEFWWNTAPGAIEYVLEVYDSEALDNLILTHTTFQNTYMATLPEENEELFWQVKAYNACGDFVFSPIHRIDFFNPAAIDDLVLWLDAAHVEVEDGKVFQWTDLSGNNFHALQENPTNRPLFVENVLNQKPVLRFDNDFLQIDFGQDFSQPLTIFIIWSKTGTQAGGAFSNLNDPMLYLTNIGVPPNSMAMYAGAGVAGLTYPFDPTFDFVLNTLSYNSGSSALYINSEFKASGNAGSNNLLQDFVIGRSKRPNQSTLWYLQGDITDIIFFDGLLSDADREEIENYLISKYAPTLNLGADIIVDYGFCPVIIDAGDHFQSFLWNTGETTQTLQVNQSGTYSVTVTDIFGRESTDNMVVSFPQADIIAQSMFLCPGDQTTLSSSLDQELDYTYLWNNDQTGHTITVDQEGEYFFTITDNQGCSINSDTVVIELDNFAITLGNDMEMCAGNSITPEILNNNAEPQTLNLSYLWSTGATTPSIQVFESGVYSVTVTNQNGCAAYAEVSVTITGIAPTLDFTAEETCLGTETLFENHSEEPPGDDIVVWLWDFGDGNTSTQQHPVHLYAEAGTYTVSLYAESQTGCNATIEQQVMILPAPVADFEYTPVCAAIPVQFTDLSTAPEDLPITSWLWDFGDGNISHEQSPEHVFELAGIYSVTFQVESNNGCTHSRIKEVIVPDELPLPGAFTLIYPKNNQIVFENTVEFWWNIASGANEYVLEVYDSEELDNLILTHTTSQTTHTATFSEENTELFWQVKAYNACADFIFSPIHRIDFFNPVTMDDLVLWLDAAHVEIEDGNVFQWTDLSGNNFHALQENPANRPLYVENVLNQKPVLSFDNDFLQIDFGQDFAQPLTIFIIWSKTGSQAGGAFGNLNDPMLYFGNLGVPPNSMVMYAGSSNNTPFDPTFDFLLNTLSYNSNSSSLYLNSQLMANGNAGSNNLLQDFVIGRTKRPNQSNLWYLEGYIAEIIFFDKSLGDIEKIKVENYLFSKYSPTLNLGSDHYITYGFCPIELNAGEHFESYLWSTGDTTQIIEVNEPGIYSVTVTDMFGRESSDSLEVRMQPMGLNTTDVVMCWGEEKELWFEMEGMDGQGAENGDDVFEGYTFLWSTGEEGPSITVSQTGTYTLTVTDTLGCSRDFTATVWVDEFEIQASLGPDLQICAGDTIGLLSSKVEGGRWKQEGGSRKVEAGRGKQEGGSRKVEAGRWKVEGGSRKVEAGRWKQEGGSRKGEGEDYKHNGFSYVWSTGETTSSIPIFESGEYSLTVTNPNGCVAQDEIYVEIIGTLPNVGFTATAACLGDATIFTNGSSAAPGDDIISYQWQFGDGATSQAINPIHTYSTPGFRDVSLFVETQVGCTRSITQAVQVYHLPQSWFTPNNACNLVPVPFTDASTDMEGGITGWQWHFRDGDGSLIGESTLQNPEFAFPEPGNASAELTTTSIAGCQHTVSRTINVRESPTLDFEFTTPCLGDPVFFTDLTTAPPWALIVSQQWDFGDGNTSSQANPSHLYQQPGIYDVSLSVVAMNGCAPTLTREVTVHSPPQASFLAPDLCVNTPHTFIDLSEVENSIITHWHWQFDDTGQAQGQFPNWTFHEAGQYDVTLTATSEAGCSGSITQTMDVHPSPEPAFSFFPRFGVSPLTVSFTNLSQGASLYEWDFGDGTAGSTAPNPVHTYTQNGIYTTTLTAWTDLGCADITTEEIKVIPVTIDVAVTDLSWQVQDNFLNITANLMNLGTLEFDTLLLELRIGGRDVIRETWTGMLRPGEIIAHTFNAQVPWNERYEYFCVEAFVPRVPEDDDPTNNTMCKAFEEQFTLLAPFPNPADNYITLGYIVPLSDRVTITLSNLHGHHLGTLYEGTADQGINTLRIPVGLLGSGIYMYRIIYREEVKVGRFMVW